MTAWELFGSHSKCTWFPLHLAKYFNSGKKYHKIAHSYLLWNFLSYLYKDSCTWLVSLDPSLIRPASIETSQLRGNTNKAAPLERRLQTLVQSFMIKSLEKFYPPENKEVLLLNQKLENVFDSVICSSILSFDILFFLKKM